MACELCTLLEEKKLSILYEDEGIVAFLNPKPGCIGHIVVAPKQHIPILEQCPDLIISRIGIISNKLSTAVFESMNIQGTNIIINNGIPAGQTVNHFSANILPRAKGDTLSFEWKPKPLNEEEMAAVELRIKEQVKNVGIIEKPAPAPEVIEEAPPEQISPRIPSSAGKDDTEENYLIKQIDKRIP